MPSEQTNHDEGHDHVKQGVCGRHASLDEKRERKDLQRVRRDGDVQVVLVK